ncbi:MAG TPA: hypothetical protein VG267_14840 [Terracidiphilus sp.]|jgi:hypothetical protein|nr:hypothetical protein [Terracidiphilus sp.]
MRPFCVAPALLVLLAWSFAAGQKPKPDPPPPITTSRPGNLDWNPDSRIPEAMRVDGDRFKYRVSVDRQRLAGPENITSPITIAEFEILLEANRGLPDDKLSELISRVMLTERATRARLEHWKTLYIGAQTQRALIAATDASAFLELPAIDVDASPTPTLAEQRRIIAAVGVYMGKVIPNLPNFLAVRNTTYFEDWPSFVDWPSEAAGPKELDDPARLRNRPFYSTGNLQTPIGFRDGQEVQQKQKGLSLGNPYGSHLSTSGEFGPILDGVLRDAARGKLSWKEWEHSADGSLAVFRFEVAGEQSHYAVSMPTAKKGSQQTTAYQGEFAVRPEDGVVMRLNVIAIMPGDADVQAANIQVEYGSVEIGGKPYICPVHAIALSKVPIIRTRAKGQNLVAPLQTQVNDVSFSQYQVFRSDMRVLPAPNPE